jgi:FkbM family methyltransferase
MEEYMIKLGGRSLMKIGSVIFEARHYRALINSFRMYEYPLSGLTRYLTGRGTYPCSLKIRTPLGVVTPTLYSHHDMLTVNEIFCRMDYECGEPKVVVDFGSNIGISALYFLTRNPDVYCYLFEPLPQNVERLKGNLALFERRYMLDPVAVGLKNGEVTFGFEPSGRYGGIGKKTDTSTQVPCRAANDILADILDKHKRIDVLKVDIETLEKEIVEQIPADMKRRINTILVEQRYVSNPYSDIYGFRQYGPVARFERTPGESRGVRMGESRGVRMQPLV